MNISNSLTGLGSAQLFHAHCCPWFQMAHLSHGEKLFILFVNSGDCIKVKVPSFLQSRENRKIHGIWEENGKTEFHRKLEFFNAKNVEIQKIQFKKGHKNQQNCAIAENLDQTCLQLFVCAYASVAMCFQYSTVSTLYAVPCTCRLYCTRAGGIKTL